MANVARPPPRPSTDRRTRLTLSPALAPDDVHRSANHTTISTRRSSKNSLLLALGDNEKAVKQIRLAPAKAAPLARTLSRKRPATALDPDATDTRPPTKITVTQPHGELLRTTNGVSAPLGIAVDDVPSARSTPRPGSAGKLTPASGPQSQDKRSLRSHDGGSRLKSDLAIYFSSYDDIISGVQKPAEFLDFDTAIYIVDEPFTPKAPAPTSREPPRTSLSPIRSRKRKASSPSLHTLSAALPLAPSSTKSRPLDYSSVLKAVNHDSDPLSDAVFFAQHRRAERKEKQLRNIEKERAMHEKVQLERLLDGLQGPDWLKVMGITGVTDGERKDWEPKRDFFVKEVEALVDKFRVWKEEEKRLRAEKEAALAAREESSEEVEDEDSDEDDIHDSIVVNGRAPPQHKTPVPRRPPRPHGFLLPYIPPEPAVPFLSFYAKPHLRAAALGKHRHGRNATAFGLPIPDFEEREFEVPEEFIDPALLRDNARGRRRRKRESNVDKETATSAQ